MQEESTVNYGLALKVYRQRAQGRSMKKFCEEEGYDYNKFIPLYIDSAASDRLGILDIRVRFTNGLELSQREGDITELLDMVRKMLG